MGRRSKIIFPLLFVLAVLLPFSLARGSSGNDNLLYNGDFEILDGDGMPDGWFTDAYLMDPGYSLFGTAEGMDGENSNAAELHNTARNDARFAQDVDVEPESVYCLSGYIRAENIEYGHGANLSVEGVYAFSENVYDTNGEWKYIEYYGETGPDQTRITVFVRLGGYSGESKGIASFDHLSLTKVEEVPEEIFPDLWYQVSQIDNADDWDDFDDGTVEAGTAGPAWPSLILIALIYILIVSAVMYRFRNNNQVLDPDGKNRCRQILPVLLFAMSVRLVFSYIVEGYAVDVNCFLSWGYTMAQNGPVQFYQNSGFCDYPPLYTYVLGINSLISGWTGANTAWTRVIFRFVPCLCDLAGCWILLNLPETKFSGFGKYSAGILLLAFNPVNVLNSAAWGQMDSVLCLLLLCVAVKAVNGRWISAIAFFVTAVLVKPQALMLGFLGLTYMILSGINDRNKRKQIWIGTGIAIVLMAVYILPFGINQETGWLFKRYSDTLSSYPYATVNTANLYYLLGGNWNKIEYAAHWAAPILFAAATALYGIIRYFRNANEKYIRAELVTSILFSVWFIVCAVLGLSWSFTGTGAMVFAFVIVITMALRNADIHFLPYLGALLFILLYVFGVKMHERYLFPAFFLLMYAWILLKDRRILYLLLLFSLTVFINEGIVLDNSIRLGSEYGHLNSDTAVLADILSVLNILGALYAVYTGCCLMKGRNLNRPFRLLSFIPVRTVDSKIFHKEHFPDRRLHWKLRDTVILLTITVFYSIIVLSTLGSTKAPQTSWSSSGDEEQIVFDLQEVRNDVRILYFGQVSRENFTFAMSTDGEFWSEEIYAQMDQQQCWKWKYVTVSYPSGDGGRNFYNNTENIYHFRGRYIRITSCQVGLVLNEILFRDGDGNNIPAEIISRSGDNPDSTLWSDPSNLLDEQDTMENLPGIFGKKQESETQPSWWNSTYFDEIYHARTGYEFTQGTVPYETSHPPLGKILISWCVTVFGMTPFGWRFAGAAAGILMLPGIYLLAKQLTKKTWPAVFACGLMSLDCMHLTQTQIATIDSFPVLFIIFAFFFMLRFMQTDFSECSYRKLLIPLALCGLNMGLSIASKWIGIYAGAGLAVLYFSHCIRQIRKKRKDTGSEKTDHFRKFVIISLWCVLFFIIVPVIIYLLSYIPYMAYNTRIRNLQDYLDAVWRAQEGMLSYHSTPGLGMDHPFYSPWWQWPIIGKPMYYATEQYIASDATLHHSIFCFGNPVVWWGALASLVVFICIWIRDKHYQIENSPEHWHLTGYSGGIQFEFLFVGFLAQYLPWVLVPRGTYIYHYFASVPFLILISAMSLPSGSPDKEKAGKIIGIIWLLFAALFFVILFPYASGMASSSDWLNIGKNILRIWY